MKFRKLTKSIRERSSELPAAAELGQTVSDLRSGFGNSAIHIPKITTAMVPFRTDSEPAGYLNFKMKLRAVEAKLWKPTSSILENSETRDPRDR